MSNLSDLLPAGAAAKQLTFTDSGSGIASKKPVILNSDGTVAEVTISSTSLSENVGTEAQFTSSDTDRQKMAYTESGKVVITYQDTGGSYYGTAVVGTVSGNTISYGTPVVFNSASTSQHECVYDTTNQKVVVHYMEVGAGPSYTGQARVGTISGTSISFGTKAQFTANNVAWISSAFDTVAGKTVTAYAHSLNGYAIVGTVSGTSISFGSEATVRSGQTTEFATVYDTNADKTVILYRESNITGAGEGVVGTVSGTSISFGTAVQFDSAPVTVVVGAYDSSSNQVICAYTKVHAKVVLGTVSGTSISFGAIVTAPTTESAEYNAVAYDSNVNKIVLATSEYGIDGTIATGTVSGTSLSFASPATEFYPSDISNWNAVAYDSFNKKVVLSYAKNNASGYALVFQTAGTAQVSNLTAQAFVGVADSAISASAAGSIIVQGGTVSGVNAGQSTSVGSEVVYEAARADHGMPIFDSSNNKVVIVYADNGDSDHGKAIVGTVSGSSVSYGTAVTFNAATTTRISGAFDSDSNKVVIAYRDDGDSNKTKAIVGTVSGTSISFGSDATITTNATGNPTSTTFDSNSNKVVVFYRDDGNSEYGTAAVGTVSGTSISFGTPVVFESATIGIIQSSSTFDSSNNKTVVAYRDVGNSSHGTAIVGTVSGTSISFGTAAVFHAASTEETFCTFDSGNNKVVVGYRDNAAPKALASSVGTVSGTSISFGAESTVQSISLYISNPSIAYSPDVGKVVLVYMDADNSSYGTYAVGEVSGTDITYETPAVFAAAATEDCGIAYDTNEDKFVISFKDAANSNYGTSVVLTFSPIALTVGTKYYVTTTGGFSSSAGDPSVNAGLAISTTSLLLNGDS